MASSALTDSATRPLQLEGPDELARVAAPAAPLAAELAHVTLALGLDLEQLEREELHVKRCPRPSVLRARGLPDNTSELELRWHYELELAIASSQRRGAAAKEFA